MVFAVVDVRFFDVEVLGHQVSELAETFTGHYSLGVLEINNLFDVGQSSAEVDVVVLVRVIFFEGEIVEDELAVVEAEGLGHDFVVVFIVLGFLEVFNGSALHLCQRIIILGKRKINSQLRIEMGKGKRSEN